MTRSEYEIYIVLSDVCNFSCAHCLNCSGSKGNRYKLSEDEFESLCRIIDEDEEIVSVHFSGGEPTLHIDLIERFQKKISRPIRYGITTNAWFGKNPEKVLDRIHVDEIVVSYDKFHAPFVSRDAVKNLLAAAVARKIQTTLNVVYETLIDLAEIEELRIPGCKIKPSQLVRSGRQSDVTSSDGIVDDAIFSSTCPSLDSEIMPVEKVIYIPGRGFTPCCGPLAFDEKAERDFVFSSMEEGFRKNKLRLMLRGSSFGEQYEKAGITKEAKGLHDRCHACTNLLARHSQTVPSKMNLSRLESLPAVYKTTELLDKADARQMSEELLLSYIYCGPIKVHDESAVLPPEITVRSFEHGDFDEFYQLYRRLYLSRFGESITENEAATQIREFPAYSNMANVRWLYYLNGVPVASLLLNPYSPHPTLNVDTVHIGFIGYDKERLTKEQAIAIKKHWALEISKRAPSSGFVSATIKWFNDPSLRFHEKLGLKPQVLRVERRVK